VGGNVIARTGPGTSGCTHSQVEWNWFVNGEKEPDLRHEQHLVRNQGDARHGWLPANLRSGDGREPGNPSVRLRRRHGVGMYTVSGQLTARSALIKRLSASTPELANVANAKVEAIASDGDSTVTRTAADGSYSLSVPRGRYTILV
jgi:hypothetical protein